MISPKKFYEHLSKKNINFFTGVPDSILKDICAYIDDNSKSNQHVISANEGNAIAIASGYHLATGKTPMVYMQNSGFGNAYNPLISLASKEVYSIPMILMIGWRGEPNIEDEPQHQKQGQVTESQLQSLDINYFILDANSNEEELIDLAIEEADKNSCPAAILVKKNTFSKYNLKENSKRSHFPVREDIIKEILNLSKEDDIFISTTGKTSRELYEIRDDLGLGQRDFLTIGSMGHSSSIALGISIIEKERKIFCIDGDGSMLMHLGSLPIIGSIGPENFIHILLNNCSHESVGGQPTAANQINFSMLAKAIGYVNFFEVSSLKELKDSWNKVYSSKGPTFFLINIKPFSRDNLARPVTSPKENKKSFMNFLDVASE